MSSKSVLWVWSSFLAAAAEKRDCSRREPARADQVAALALSPGPETAEDDGIVVLGGRVLEDGTASLSGAAYTPSGTAAAGCGGRHQLSSGWPWAWAARPAQGMQGDITPLNEARAGHRRWEELLFAEPDYLVATVLPAQVRRSASEGTRLRQVLQRYAVHTPV